jgi:hypothetical protein
MAMLASLLPGVRELRAPLAAGYLWLVALWIVFAPRLSELTSTEGVYRDIYNLGRAVGRPAIAIASGFVAYLIGTLSVGVTTSLNDRLNSLNRASTTVRKPILQAVLGRLDEALKGENRALEDLRQFLLDILQSIKRDDPATFVRIERVDVTVGDLDLYYRHYQLRISLSSDDNPDQSPKFGIVLLALKMATDGLERLERLTSNEKMRRKLAGYVVNIPEYINDCIADLPHLAARLVGKEPEVYGSYDRLRAESEFRVGVAVPLAVVFIAMAYRSTPHWVWGVLPCMALAELGRRSSKQAFAQLAESLNAKRLDSPVLEGIGRDPLKMHSAEEYSKIMRDFIGALFKDLDSRTEEVPRGTVSPIYI